MNYCRFGAVVALLWAAAFAAAPARAQAAAAPGGVLGLTTSASVEVSRDILAVDLLDHARRP